MKQFEFTPDDIPMLYDVLLNVVKAYVVDDMVWSSEESANKFLDMKFTEWTTKNTNSPTVE